MTWYAIAIGAIVLAALWALDAYRMIFKGRSRR
jgi:hypothetical protein